MRKLLLIIALFLTVNLAFAGDIASFVNVGFSGDSRYFMFGQFGVSGSYVYSDLYTVDVAANSFAQNGVSKKEYPAGDNVTQDGSGAFLKGIVDLNSSIKKYGIDPLLKGRVLYININGDPVRDVEFRDFSSSVNYKINLEQEVSEGPSGVESSFSLKILAEKESGSARAYSAGSPSVKRKNVKGYSIKNVILAPDGRGMVIVVEMSLSEGESTSVRYMVETLKL